MSRVIQWLPGCLVLAALCTQAQQAEPALPAEPQVQAVAQGQAIQGQTVRPVADATINLRTSITGNQEQPRVMYIMPWQSPRATELDMEMLSSQQEAVFGHVEREELLRTLEQLEPVPQAAP